MAVPKHLKAWNAHVMNVYRGLKNKDKSATFADALKVAKRSYKK